MGATFTQAFKVQGGPINVAAIKAQLYVHNLPAGTFTLSIKKQSEIIASWDFTSAALQTSISMIHPYFYVKYPFLKPSGFRLDRGDYLFELSSVGYTYSGASWIGWCKDWQAPTVDIYDPQPENFIGYPYAFQILQYEDSDK